MSSLSEDEFRDWVTPHWSSMYLAIARAVPESDRSDVLQDALFAAWRMQHKFDPSRGSPRTWLVTIAMDKARKSHRIRRPSHLTDRTHKIGWGQADDVALDLRQAVSRLPPKERVTTELFYYVGLTALEVSVVLGIPSGTVKYRLSRARTIIRNYLGSDYIQ